MNARTWLLLAIATAAATAGLACGDDADSDSNGDHACTGTASGVISGDFTCHLAASSTRGAAQSVISMTATTGPMGTDNVSITFTIAGETTERSYAMADLKDFGGQFVHPTMGIFGLTKRPPQGTVTLTVKSLTLIAGTTYEAHGTADAVMVSDSGSTENVHFDF